MDISVYKFNPKAPDIAPEALEKVKARLEKELLTSICYGGPANSLWLNGCYKSMGYRFDLDDPVRVLVNHTDEYGNEWIEHNVPCRDKKIVRKYIREFEGDNVAWIFLNEDDIDVL